MRGIHFVGEIGSSFETSMLHVGFRRETDSRKLVSHIWFKTWRIHIGLVLQISVPKRRPVGHVEGITMKEREGPNRLVSRNRRENRKCGILQCSTYFENFQTLFVLSVYKLCKTVYQTCLA